MIKMTVDISEKDLGMEKILREVRAEAKYVDIGVQPDEDEKLLIIATAHEYGATINHPGGTSYGYKTDQDEKKGRVRFLKKGEGYMVLGTTKPHTITIPPRPYIRTTIDENEEKYLNAANKLSKQLVDGKIDKFKALSLMGQLIETDIKNKIIEIKSPANAPATIRKKGSDNPLVDTGLLGGSIRYVVFSEKQATTVGGSDDDSA